MLASIAVAVFILTASGNPFVAVGSPVAAPPQVVVKAEAPLLP